MSEGKRQYPFSLVSVRIVQYILGFLTLALGVIIILRSDFGAGSWDATVANLSLLLNSTLGVASLIINFTIFTIILLFRRRKAYLLIIVPVIMMSLAIDFWDILIIPDSWLSGSNFLVRLVFFVLGITILPLGLALIITTNFRAGTVDELMLLIMDYFKTKKVFFIRLFIEILAIVLAIIFSFLANKSLGAVNYGTLLIAFLLPPILSFHVYWIRKIIYEKKIKHFI